MDENSLSIGRVNPLIAEARLLCHTSGDIWTQSNKQHFIKGFSFIAFRFNPYAAVANFAYTVRCKKMTDTLARGPLNTNMAGFS